ncbi:MAG TPA: sigma-70 family RNA polymerase sigma factor [Verrucomicrobiae bacterium]|nr:sigma-70 family RNA polymerase sigma factor [Verrucomicrobiae bacterium]
MKEDDWNLLRQYVRNGSEEAFATLVNRHINLVYSVALRQVGSRPLAEEVAQSVFTDLARNANHLRSDAILTSWLHRVAYRTAVDVIRKESRRQNREQKAMEAASVNTTTPDWARIEPLLNEEVESLDDANRTVILLRFFENKSLREVGEALGISEDAAQKRVSRAVDRLRESLSKRGVAVGAGGLVVAISANAVQAAPAGLAATISVSAALAGAPAAATTATTLTKAIAMTTLQKALVTATIVATAGAGIYEAREASNLRDQVRSLQQQQTLLAGQIQQLQSERNDAANRLAFATDENVALKADSAELSNLRDEVARLNAASTNSLTLASQAWLERVAELKRRMEETPGAKIPELKFVTNEDWLDAGSKDLNTDADYRRALSRIRAAGEAKVATMLHKALAAYMQDHGHQMPSDLGQLQPFFDDPLDEAILDRWEIAPKDTVKSLRLGGDVIITQKAPVDDVFDQRFGVGPNGYGTCDFLSGETAETMMPVWEAYRTAHNGQYPSDTALLEPYITTPEQHAAFEKLMLYNSAMK